LRKEFSAEELSHKIAALRGRVSCPQKSSDQSAAAASYHQIDLDLGLIQEIEQCDRRQRLDPTAAHDYGDFGPNPISGF
jgi:hypothetical protein